MIAIQGINFLILHSITKHYAAPIEPLNEDFLFVKYGINKINFGYFILGYKVVDLPGIWPLMNSEYDVEHSLKVLDKLCPLMNQPLLKNIFS